MTVARRRLKLRALALALGLVSGLGLTSALPVHAGRETVGKPRLVTYDVGARPREIAVADLNGDGRRDVVVASADGTLTVLIGTAGPGLRALAPAIPCGNEPSDVDALDVDNDRDPDLVVANHETSRVTVLLNDGHARFTPAAGSPLETGARPHVHGLATGDFDGDGWIDVAVESADTREVRVLFNGPRGFSTARGISVGTMPYYRLGVADVTDDGRADILVPGHGNNSVVVVRMKQDRVATAERMLTLAARPWMVVGDDVNGDHRNDIVAVVSDGVSVWLAGSDGFSEAPGSPFQVAGATEVATGDMDGDGIADIAVGPWEGRDVIILAGGSFARRTLRACERPIGLALADLDGDHRAELCVACAKENRVVVVHGGL